MKFTVTQNKVDLVEASTVNEGEYNATICEFEYSSSYNGLVKKAIFTLTNTGDSYEVPLVDGTCDIPVDVLKSKEYVSVGVYGYEIDANDELVLRYSPTPARFQVAPGSYKENVKNPSDVTPSQAAILEAEIQKKIDEIDAVEEDIIEKRDSGAFDGKDGKDGEAATIAVGTTTTLEAGSDATVENVGTTSAATFNFGIPRGADGKDGADGQDGAAATIAVGTVTTLPAGSNATVTNAGTSQNATFNFGIPQGAKGDPGQDGADGKDGKDGVDGKDGKDGQDGQNGQDGAAATIEVGTVTTLPAGSNATVTNAGTSSAATFNFGIPQGAKGDPGQNGTNGQDGAAATIEVGTTAVNFGQSTSSVSITNSGTSSAAVLNFTFNFAFADGNNVSY